MSVKKNTIKVKQVEGEPLSFLVESWSEKEFPHKVDLDINSEYFGCDCDHYKYRISKNVKNGEKLWVPGVTMCRHIEAARNYFAAKNIRIFSEILNKTNK